MLFNLSLRYKLPLWGTALIVSTTLLLSGSFMAQAWTDLRQDVSRSAVELGRIMAPALFPSLLHDDLWRAYETLSLPFAQASDSEVAQAENLIVLDRRNQVYVSSHPERYPVLSEFAVHGADYRQFVSRLDTADLSQVVHWEPPDSSRIMVAIPIAEGGVRLGTLVITYDKAVLWQRFERLIGRALAITALALAIILPASAYWGRRMTEPLVQVSERMGRISQAELETLEPGIYPYRDEVGQLYAAYNEMVRTLLAKQQLETEIVKSERLAAIGRLTAGIAHEINNPLAGLVTAVDTLKQRRDLDPKVMRHLDLIERGLMQIRDTVGALLVQTRVQTRPLSLADLEDIRTLLQAQVAKHRINLIWEVELPATVPLSASLLRQILINLLLNAVQAAGDGGEVELDVHVREAMGSSGPPTLAILVRNTGTPLAEPLLAHLFEPFASTREGGHGLGLWVTYQIVTQLNGSIAARNADNRVEFNIELPLGDATCNTASH